LLQRRRDRPQHENGMEQGDQCIAPNDELKGKKASRSKLAEKLVRLAHMNQPCLHPAFVSLFVTVRGRSLSCSLCWNISGL
jgi:hypothetical protein